MPVAPQGSHGDFSLPSGLNMHVPSNPSPGLSSPQAHRRPSWQSQRLSSSLRSGKLGQSPRAAPISAPPTAEPQDSTDARASGSQRRRVSVASSFWSIHPKWWRVRLFRGMVKDIKRRAPYYWSDLTDAWDYRIVPATIYMYFAKYACPHTFPFSHPITPYFSNSRNLYFGSFKLDVSALFQTLRLTGVAVSCLPWLSR